MSDTHNISNQTPTQEIYPGGQFFVRLFVSVFEDIEDSEPIEERRWKNYDGYHFVSRVIKSENLSKHIDPSKEFRNNLKYALSIPAHLIRSFQELVEYLCKAFGIKDHENYTIMLNEDTMLFDLSTIRQNDKIKLVRKDKLIKIAKMTKEISKCKDLMAKFTKEYLDYVQKHPFILSLPKEWKNLETVDLSASKENSEKSIASNIGDNSSRSKKLPRILQNLHQRVSVFEYDNELFYETPAFKEFMDECSNCTTREELQRKIKELSEMRGFKVVQPQGEVINQKREFKNVFHCIKAGKNRKGSSHKRTGCPFTLIYQKGPGCLTYQLTKFRGAHNHQLDDFPEDYSKIAGMGSGGLEDEFSQDYNLSKAMNIKHDESPPKELKAEDNTEDYSVDGLPSSDRISPCKSLESSLHLVKEPSDSQTNEPRTKKEELKPKLETKNTEGHNMKDIAMK
ncbi:unnamed protein product [Moneuplotes crassus]|uniref:Uncharacterized protein n=1 Tax=Euplotes crassus TaxID=5936 RepID=A0AAD1UQL7_EUPCR|nr:unnamed protein product [Moneuplotes crassus]